MKDLINKPSSFVAIDASTNSLAFAYFKDGELIQYGKIKYFGTDIYDKIVDTAHKTKAFFDTFESKNINHIVIEQVIYVNSPKTAANLAMSHGALVSAAAITGVQHIASVSPMVWQNWIGNKRLTVAEKDAVRKANPNKTNSWYKSQERQVRKQKTIKYVNDKFSIHLDDDDVADAVAIGAWTLDNWSKVF